MTTVLTKWGNSQGIRIPKDILDDLGVKVDDVLDLEVKGQSLIIRKKFRHQTLEERAAVYQNKLNLGSEVNWGKAEGDEVW